MIIRGPIVPERDEKLLYAMIRTFSSAFCVLHVIGSMRKHAFRGLLGGLPSQEHSMIVTECKQISIILKVCEVYQILRIG
jgi:hypothetical protein